MITQAIKNWLHKMLAWWPWRKSSEIEYSHAASPLNKETAEESASRSLTDGVTSQPGITPRLSTIEEKRPERIVHPLFPAANERLSPPTSSIDNGTEPLPALSQEEGTSLVVPSSSSPTYEQQLEFLYYLYKRGIVNEGFEEGKAPDQYRIRD